MATRMQQRRGTAAQWISTNSGNGPILSPGEIGFESDTNKFKIGDGVNHWADLTYFTDADSILAAVSGIVDGAPDLLNTLNELAAALGDDPNFLSSYATQTYVDTAVGNIDLSSKQDVVANVSATEIGYLDGVTSAIQTQLNSKLESSDLTGYATETYVDTAVANVEVDLSTAAGTNLDWNAGTSQFDVDTASLLANPTISSGLTLDGTGDFTISADANIILDATTEVYIGSSASGNEVATQSYVDTAVGNVDLSTKQDVVSGVSSTEIGYLDGVTSAIQTQIDAKAPLNAPTFTGTVTASNDLVVDGDFTVNGTNFSASATSITIEDNLVQIAHNNPANTVDLGLVVGYNDGTAKHAGLVKDTSANTWKLFKGVTTEPATTVDFTQGSLDDLAVAGLTASSLTVGDVSNVEFGYLNGVTSAIQTQLDAKASLTGAETLTNKTLTSPVISTISNTGTITVPSTTGTLALTSQLPASAAPLTAGLVHGFTNSTSNSRTVLGYQAGNVATGTKNTLLGYRAGVQVTTGTDNTLIGNEVGFSITNSSNNVIVGGGNTNGNQNVSVGSAIGTMGSNNVVLGAQTLGSNSSFSMSNSVIIGSRIGHNAGTFSGSDNVIIGREVMQSGTVSGAQNTLIGSSTLSNGTSASNNVAVGFQAGNQITTGTNNIVIGSTAAATSSTVSNEITLGNASITSFRIPGLSLTVDSSNPIVQLTSTQTLTNKTLNNPVIISPEERMTVSATAATGTINFDASTQGVLYYTSNASADWTLNVRGNSGTTLNSILAIGDAITVSFLATQGSTAYRHSALTIDGSAQTVAWSGGTAPSAGNASGIDAYSFTIIKTASATFTVLGAGPVKYA